ncbi:MAG: hypothetical protein IKX86_02620 [Clostridia bacterium]|nr:hypothetical protein [Clostridia bacterium]MBR5767556.1 hypothetical protein [Clostridia bacterium]
MTEQKETGIEFKGEKVSENIWLCPDGVYRWTYEYKMLKNPTIIFTVWKVLGISCGIMLLFGLIIGLIDGGFTVFGDLLGMGKTLLIVVFGVLLPLSIIAYLILAATYGWKYQVLFEMTEDSVSHIQMPKQFKKAEALGWITTAVGLAAGKPYMIGSGLGVAARSTMTTEFRYVASIKSRRKRGTIHVNQKLDRNQVYAEDADFEFVEKFLISHCPSAKVSSR